MRHPFGRWPKDDLANWRKCKHRIDLLKRAILEERVADSPLLVSALLLVRVLVLVLVRVLLVLVLH